MRNLIFRIAAIAGVVLTLGACADSPTQSTQSAPDRAPGTSVQQTQVQGCVSDGVCVLDPIVVDPCDPYEALDWCEDDGGTCMTSVFQSTDPTVQSCPGDGGTPGGGGTPPAPGDPGTVCPTTDTGLCPRAPALITVAGRNHEFQFHGSPSYPLRRLTGGRSPATYQIGLPTTSKDAWWIAESGTITVYCRGAWITRRLWVGTLTLVDSDLHMVIGPGHPDF
jgi:hypothetical protein